MKVWYRNEFGKISYMTQYKETQIKISFWNGYMDSDQWFSYAFNHFVFSGNFLRFYFPYLLS